MISAAIFILAKLIFARHRTLHAVTVGVAFLTIAGISEAGKGPRLIEVSDELQTYTGMIVAKSSTECFIVSLVDRLNCRSAT
jgi:hypothetical protein